MLRSTEICPDSCWLVRSQILFYGQVLQRGVARAKPLWPNLLVGQAEVSEKLPQG